MNNPDELRLQAEAKARVVARRQMFVADEAIRKKKKKKRGKKKRGSR